MTEMIRDIEIEMCRQRMGSAPAVAALLAIERDNFAVDWAAIPGMSDSQLQRVADACRFLRNNLPPSTQAD